MAVILKITEKGHLEIIRSGRISEQYCPHSFADSPPPSRCGTWCPLFGEPVEFYDKANQCTLVRLTLCRTTWMVEVGQFIDLRQSQGKP